jgi:hypothetical protein
MGEPFDRTATIARVGFLMPGLTDAGLVELARVAGVLAGTCARDLTPATLAAEQRGREAPKVVEGPWSGERPRSPYEEPRTGYEATGEATTGEEPACSAMPWSPLAAG